MMYWSFQLQILLKSPLILRLLIPILLFIAILLPAPIIAQEQNPTIYVFLGYPGAGKGTTAQSLTKRGYLHLSIGDWLRKEATKDTELGRAYRQKIASSSSFVPETIFIPVIKSKIAEACRLHRNLILDGFPRTVAQHKLLLKILAENNIYRIKPVYFEIDPLTVQQRIQYRRSCTDCGWIYHLVNLPPRTMNTCDHCGEKLVKRGSDNLKTIKHRIRQFETRTRSLVELYKKNGILLTIDAKQSNEYCLKKFIEKT